MDAGHISLIGIAGTAVGWVVRSVFAAGQKGSEITTTVAGHEKKIEEHSERLDNHDERFRGLNTEFVPRPEVNESLGSIKESQRRQEQLLLHLVTGKPIKPDVSE